MAIKFCFQGLVTGAEIKEAVDADGNKVDVSTMSDVELCAKLKAGKLFISLGEYLYDKHDSAEIEILDFEVEK